MFCYRLTASWYETYDHWELLHPVKYGMDDFKWLVEQAMVLGIKVALEEESSYIGTDEIMEHTKDIMIKCLGFTELKVQASYHMYGSNIVRDKEVAVTFTGDGEEGREDEKEFPSVNAYNKVVEDNMWDGMKKDREERES